MAQNDYKRRLINQLPAVFQTDTLRNFFSATIDNLFQPGKSESISGYIGQKPSYYNPTTDFYVEEPTAIRAAYQLEPAMVSIDNAAVYTNTLCYDDLINYLRSQGAITSDHSRMFKGEYYSWSPPADLDKLNNYLQYFWMGSLSDEEDARTLINLRSPRETYAYDGNPASTFLLPEAMPEFADVPETPMVTVNGEIVSSSVADGVATISLSGVTVGSIIETFRYGDLKTMLTGLSSFKLYHFIPWTDKETAFVMNGHDEVYANQPRQYYVGDLVYIGDKFGNGQAYRCVTAHEAGATPDLSKFTMAGGATDVTSSMRFNLIDANGPTRLKGTRYFVDGVGTALEFSKDFTGDYGGSTARYQVIDRRSKEQSPWARRNLWVHKSSLEWSGYDITPRKAKRPIIEFLPNLELFNYGLRRVEDVQGALTTEQATIVDNWSVYSWGDIAWDNDKVNLSQVNGRFLGRLDASDDTYLGSVMVDGGYIVQPNDRIIVQQNVSPDPELNNRIYAAISNPDVPLPSGASQDLIELVLTAEPKRGDIVRVVPGKGAPLNPEEQAKLRSVFYDAAEFWYNGVEWVPATPGSSPPLFALYDADQNSLFDTNVYYNTDFTGSELFSYKVGTGATDTVLGFPVVYNTFGQPTFEVDSIVHRVHYDGGEIKGYYYHHFLDTDTYSNNWFPVDTLSTQKLANGVYEIPMNLQANPGNLEIEEISRNQWFDQFSEIMEAQDGFVGHPYSTNNWRDTKKEMGFGTKILQHRSPLLKTMLISSNQNFDLPSAIRYVDQEYTRFRNRFVQTIVDLYNNGGATEFNTADEWVTLALDQLRLNKTAEFPFALSMVGGDQYFIPATPATLGVMQATVPGMYTDETYPTPVMMIRGHDGSLIPAFGDWRDPIMLALEERIYDNLNDAFKTEAKPVFDIDAAQSSWFYEGDYSTAEVNAMLSPSFERWAQLNRLDYRINTTYDPSNPFTWNYGTSLDFTGKPLPGNWRGIYKLYFDTDRPHLAPWEMLGFAEKPSYWDMTYGPAPYTSGNTKLWDDLRDGYVAGGVRMGTDARYARPELYDYLPVDEEGRLLDPISAKIVATQPTITNAGAPWKIGDHGPVENLWRHSPSFGFAKALAGFLMRPAQFVEQGWDTVNVVKDNTNQWISKVTGNRPLNKDVYVHGEMNEAGTARIQVTGIQQWISDYMLMRGQDPVIFGNAIRGLDVRLAHKMAGYTSSGDLRATADNFGLIPPEDVTVQFYRSPSIREEFYGGVVIEWTGNSYRVIGYDTRSPFFNIIPPETAGPKSIISLSDTPEPALNSWQPGRYYPLNTIVAYNNTFYIAITSHTSGQSFDPNYWNAQNAVPTQAPRVTKYLTGKGFDLKVPYGTEFQTTQEVADFLLGYERYLLAHGWLFDQVDDNNIPLDWTKAVRDFLEWNQVTWAPGNIITLSPSAAGVYFQTDHGSVMNVLTPVNGAYGMVERTGKPIDREKITVNRIDGDVEFLSSDFEIYGVRVNICEDEHVLFFNNKTIFNDVIYDPIFNLRQPRLRLIARRTTNWSGRLDAPGYVLTDDGITSNFYKAADDLLTMFDIEEADNVTLRDHARHIIGYDSRDYLSSLVLSDVEQFEFYQGLNHQKGAPGAFNKLLRSDFIDQSRDIRFFEEWAIKQSTYGAVEARNRISFLLEQSAVKRDPQVIHFHTGTPDAVADRIELIDTTKIDEKWVERPKNPLKAFSKRTSYDRREGDLPVAGYVRTTEVDHVVYSSDEIAAIYDVSNNIVLNNGEMIWVHAMPQQSEIVGNQWYMLGTYHDGYWDGSSNTVALANSSYISTDTSGDLVFQSKPYEAPFVSSDVNFVPVVGQTYTFTFTVAKTVADTTELGSYIRPAFDAFRSDNGQIVAAQGTKSGEGYDSTLDLIDTSNWEIGRYYDVTVQWTCPASPGFSSARARIRLNRTVEDNTVDFPNAVYQIQKQTLTMTENYGWDVFRVYEMSSTGEPNTITNAITRAEDATVTTMRLYTSRPHGLTATDVGSRIVIEGSTLTDPDIEGVQEISAVGIDYFEILVLGVKGLNYAAENAVSPKVRILKSVRFPDMMTFNSTMQARKGTADGDLAYVDGKPWRVMERATMPSINDDYDEEDGVYQQENVPYWKIVRQQPKRIDADFIASALIYDQKTNITPTQLQAEPLTLAHINLHSPLVGKLVGRAEREIDYKLEYDPALYSSMTYDGSITNPDQIPTTNNRIAGGSWGRDQVGRVWWDLSTVRFLETESDDVAFGVTPAARYDAELDYRTANWAQIAPATSVDVYEWVRSLNPPTSYDGDGTVYNADSPSWVETYEYDNLRGSIKVYYFWVKNREVTPFVDFRRLPTATIARIITDPQLLDIPWFAPVIENGMLVGSVDAFLDDKFGNESKSGTVLQVELSDHYEGVVHTEWALMRPEDERSLPSAWLWQQLRDSLVGFDDRKTPVPAPIPAPVIETPVNLPITGWATLRSDDAPVVPESDPIWITSAGKLPLVSYDKPYSTKLFGIDPNGFKLTYDLVGDLPAGLALNSETGVLSGKTTAPAGATFTVNLNNGKVTVPRTFTLEITDYPGVTWQTPAPLGTYQINQTITQVIFLATGGVGTINYNLAANSVIPPGLAFLNNRLTGAMQTVGAFTFTIIATDGVTSVPREFTIRSTPAPIPPVWQTPAGDLGVNGTGVDFQLVATDEDEPNA